MELLKNQQYLQAIALSKEAAARTALKSRSDEPGGHSEDDGPPLIVGPIIHVANPIQFAGFGLSDVKNDYADSPYLSWNVSSSPNRIDGSVQVFNDAEVDANAVSLRFIVWTRSAAYYFAQPGWLSIAAGTNQVIPFMIDLSAFNISGSDVTHLYAIVDDVMDPVDAPCINAIREAKKGRKVGGPILCRLSRHACCKASAQGFDFTTGVLVANPGAIFELLMVSHDAANLADLEVTSVTGTRLYSDIKSKVGVLDLEVELSSGHPLSLVINGGNRLLSSQVGTVSRITADSPLRYTIAFEDGTDGDYNDFVISLILR